MLIAKGTPFVTLERRSCSSAVLRTLRTYEEKANKSVHVTFRLTEEEYAPFDRAIRELEISKSEFFRLLTIGKIKTTHQINAISRNTNGVFLS